MESEKYYFNRSKIVSIFIISTFVSSIFTFSLAGNIIAHTPGQFTISEIFLIIIFTREKANFGGK